MESGTTERGSEPTAHARPHRGRVGALIALASVVGFFAVFAVWVSRQLLETDTWVNTSSQLLENEDIQVAVAGFLTDSLYNSTDVEAGLAKALPPRAKPLADPAAGALRELANRLALEALQRPRVQQLWENANRDAQRALLTIVKGGTPTVSTQGGNVTLNLSTIVDQVGSDVGVDVSGKVPPSVGSVTILKSNQLATVQDIVNALRLLTLALTIGALFLYALAIYLAHGWRRRAVRNCGLAFVGVGLAVLAARSLAGHLLVDSLASSESVEPAAQATWDIGTSLLQAGGAAMVGYGIVIIVGAWLAGPGRLARPLRRDLTPLLRNRGIAYLTLAVLLLLVFWWNPTPGTSRLIPSVALVVLAVAGLEALRWQALRDFPDETTQRASERWRERYDSLASRWRPGAAQVLTAGAGAPGDDRLAALERLVKLRDSGALTPAEFEREKALVMRKS